MCLLTKSQRPDLACAAPQEPQQHGRRHKAEKLHEKVVAAEFQVEELKIEIALLEFQVDLFAVLAETEGGQQDCLTCAYFRRRAAAEMRVWEEKNSRMLDRWLWWSGHVLLKTVPKGTPQWVAGPWPTDPQCQHDV